MPIFVTLIQTLGHFAIALLISKFFNSPLAFLASYFLINMVRYSLTINNFAYQYAKNPEATEKILRTAYNKQKDEK